MADRLAGQGTDFQPVPAETGSLVDSGEFQPEDAPAAAAPDPAVRLAEPRPGREDDTLHVSNDKLPPSAGFPANLTLHAPPDETS